MKAILFFGLILGFTTSRAEIREIKSMTQILSSVDLDTLLIFDLDETIISNFTYPITPAEAMTPGMIRHFQDQGIRVMALTARPAISFGFTNKQMRSLNVNFLRSPAVAGNHFGRGKVPFKFINGIEYSGPKNNKGKALTAFLKQAKFWPKKIVFVDDRLYNAKAVNEELNQYKVEHLEFRYGAMDELMNQPVPFQFFEQNDSFHPRRSRSLIQVVPEALE